MIIDRFENILNAPYPSIMHKIESFLKDKNEIMKMGRHEICGNDFYANVCCYNSKPFEQGLLETHEKYVDVQLLISGEEYLYWAPATNLINATPYDIENDIAFWKNPDQMSRVHLYPGVFTLLFPSDAHMPQIQITSGKNDPIHKIIFKINFSLFKG